MAENEKKKGTLSQIIVPVAITLLVGTSSPWWINKFFSNNPTPPVPGQNRKGITPPDNNDPSPNVRGSLTVTTTPDPPTVRPGEQATVTTFVQNGQGTPVSGAMVSLASGGGKFRTTGTPSVAGKTDLSGIFRASWSCNPCAPAYINDVRVTKKGFTEARGQWQVEIH
jgi:hypothetical protein